MVERPPIVFVPHGGGPWPCVQTCFMREDGDKALQGCLAGGNDPPCVAFEGTMLGAKLSAFQYG